LRFGTSGTSASFIAKTRLALAQLFAGSLADVDAADCRDTQLFTDAICQAELASDTVCRSRTRAFLGVVDGGDGFGFRDSAAHALRGHHESADRVFGARVMLRPHHKPAVEVFRASSLHAPCMPLDVTAALHFEVEGVTMASTSPCKHVMAAAHCHCARPEPMQCRPS
jgi:hypothetical protein